MSPSDEAAAWRADGAAAVSELTAALDDARRRLEAAEAEAARGEERIATLRALADADASRAGLYARRMGEAQKARTEMRRERDEARAEAERLRAVVDAARSDCSCLCQGTDYVHPDPSFCPADGHERTVAALAVLDASPPGGDAEALRPSSSGDTGADDVDRRHDETRGGSDV